MAVDAFEKIKGDKTPAVLVCVYGNRNYDDALLELKDISEANGFVPIAAGAFIARHSIFSDVAVGRPDKEDLHKNVSDYINLTTKTNNIACQTLKVIIPIVNQHREDMSLLVMIGATIAEHV